jgi:hypothetical protein
MPYNLLKQVSSLQKIKRMNGVGNINNLGRWHLGVNSPLYRGGVGTIVAIIACNCDKSQCLKKLYIYRFKK